jgi:hypothetical protein
LLRPEEEKRIVPFLIKADADLSQRISNVLTRATAAELVSHADFTPILANVDPIGILRELGALAREDD